ncbi:MAG: hypothetical protein JWO06_2237 [Bacteroidota bacterium]|nr:hypothetical protein [Bacteroidota bacterium]
MDWLNSLLGLTVSELTPGQMAARAVVVFFISLAYIRIAGLRTFGKSSAFDQITAIIYGAIMGRSVVSTSSFGGALLATLVIMLLHRLVAYLTLKSKKLGAILKGKPLLLFRNGNIEETNTRKAHITAEDMSEAMRLLLTINNLDEVKEVYLERSGELSVIKKEEKP